MNTPDCVFKWQDDKTDAIGWVVLDKIINGVSGGGIFMHAKATKEETADIAKNMTKKFTVTVPQIGGAKAGIRFDHTDLRANEVLRRFIHANKLLLENVWVTAGDLNTDDTFIEKVITEELGLTCCQHYLGVAVSKATKKANLSKNLAKLIGKTASNHAKLIEATVGYGLAEAILTALELKNPKLVGKARVIIQGFGAVGSNLAYYLSQKKIAKVVAICDKDGIIHNADGLPIDLLLKRRIDRYHGLAKKGDARAAVESAKNCIVNLTAEDKKKLNFIPRPVSNKEYMNQFFTCEKAEVFSPCAFRYSITIDVADILINNTWYGVEDRFVISGANNPYGALIDGMLIEDKKNQVLDHLFDNDVMVVPDWVANSGTAQLFHRGLSVPFDLTSKELSQTVLDACAKPIRTFITDAYHRSNNPYALERQCYKKAQHQIQNPIPLADDSKDSQHVNPGRSRYILPPNTDLKYSLEERYKMVREVGEECIQEDELKKLLDMCLNPVCYDGFEPSGRMHIAQGLYKASLVNNMTQAGFTYIFWIADWFALMNHKLDGDLHKIQNVGKYFIEVWKACGMNMDRVKFLWASDEIQKYYNEYMEIFLDIASKTNIGRVKNCMQIMGRKEDKFMTQSASHIVYSCMQCADIFFLGVDVCQLGMDQRKVNMLAREYAKQSNRRTPVVLSHHMLAGLKKGQTKMSKSDPNSAIFMEDTVEDVNRKIKNSYCVEGEIKGNPCVEYMKYIVFPNSMDVKIERKDQETLVYVNYEEFEKDYSTKKIHPADLKLTLAKYINDILEPIRKHFRDNKYAKDLLQRVKKYRVTK